MRSRMWRRRGQSIRYIAKTEIHKLCNFIESEGIEGPHSHTQNLSIGIECFIAEAVNRNDT